MSYTRITVETRGHVFLMGLNRPEKRNAFDLEMYEEPVDGAEYVIGADVSRGLVRKSADESTAASFIWRA